MPRQNILLESGDIFLDRRAVNRAPLFDFTLQFVFKTANSGEDRINLFAHVALAFRLEESHDRPPPHDLNREKSAPACIASPTFRVRSK